MYAYVCISTLVGAGVHMRKCPKTDRERNANALTIV